MIYVFYVKYRPEASRIKKRTNLTGVLSTWMLPFAMVLTIRAVWLRSSVLKVSFYRCSSQRLISQLTVAEYRVDAARRDW